TPLDRSGLARIVSQIYQASPPVESVAVCLLFSFTNPAHEQAAAQALATLNIPVSLSLKILPEYREYERTSTTVINAYLVPMMSRYLRSLMDGLVTGGRRQEAGGRSRPSDRTTRQAANQNLSAADTQDSAQHCGNSSPASCLLPPASSVPLRVMQSNGGSVSASVAATEPVRAILSGPAGGVVGALRVTAAAGIRDIITFDMGGTSTDAALCRGDARTTNEALVVSLPVAVPIMDIHTVGAGGGSIARVDEAGALRVGPESAGADPGPACYGRGNEGTVT